METGYRASNVVKIDIRLLWRLWAWEEYEISFIWFLVCLSISLCILPLFPVNCMFVPACYFPGLFVYFSLESVIQ